MLVEVDGRFVACVEAPASRPVCVALLTRAIVSLHVVPEDDRPRDVPADAQFLVTDLEGEAPWRRGSWAQLLNLPDGGYQVRHGDAVAALVLGPVESDD